MKLIVVSLLCAFLCSSCNLHLSVEKRRYRDGYCIEVISKNRIKEPIVGGNDRHESKCISSGRLAANACSTASIEKAEETNKTINKSDPVVVQGVLRNSISRKEKIMKISSGRYLERENDGSNSAYVFVFLLLLAGFALTFIYSSTLWLALAGMIALIVTLLNISFSGPVPIKEIAAKEVEADSPASKKKRIPLLAIMSLLIGVVTLASYFFFYGAFTLFLSMVGAAFSADAIQKIKKDREKKRGMGIAAAGLTLNMLSLFFLVYVLISYMQLVL